MGNWTPVPAEDPVVNYLTQELWDQPELPTAWEVARRSQAVYVFREIETNWQVVAKYYVVKTGETAEKNAHREFALIEQARQSSLSSGLIRAIQALTIWRGILFLEFVDGLTLEDIIAVRRSRPGTVIPSLGKIAELLALLHSKGQKISVLDNNQEFSQEAHKIVDNLARWGVLKDNPIVQDGLVRHIKRWSEKPEVLTFSPALNHGDATTTNFIFPNDGNELVAIDWERAKIADPAADLGRITAEIEHCISQHGGGPSEALPLIEHLNHVYAQKLDKTIDAEALVDRARYYRAITSLRIARNGWLPRLERTQLVAQAMALLA